jgi:hypothetical protein
LRIGIARSASTISAGRLCVARRWNSSRCSSYSHIEPPVTPASVVARETIVASTVSRSSDELTACPTSPSARSSRTDFVSSLNSRTFSIAMTAWSANVVTSSICLSVNGSTRVFHSTITPSSASPASIGTASIVR